jgi:hypothetical protein
MRRLLIAALAVFACLALASPALAGGGEKVIRDCTDDGVLQGHYTQAELSDALANLPTDVDEYTDCRNVIRHAQLGGAGGGGGSGGAGGGGGGGTSGGAPPPPGTDPLASATPEERAAVERVVSRAQKHHTGVQLGRSVVRPGTLGFSGLSSLSTLPTVLLVVLTLIAAAALAALAYVVRSRVVTRRAA